MLIATVEYKWGTRYWCFTNNFVSAVYDKCGDAITSNPMLAKGFADMSLDELKCKYDVKEVHYDTL